CYRAVINATTKQKKLKANRLLIGGKSMGGRIASQVAASEADLGSGFVFFWNPLHPPAPPDKLRDATLNPIKAPMLFWQGSGDAFGTEEEIRTISEDIICRPRCM